MRKINENAKNVSEAKLNELVENANLILAEARRKILNDQPFIGAVAMNFGIYPTRDFRIPTACTDGTNVFFDIDFLSSLSPEHQQFVLAHEFWHCCLAHFMRTEGRDPKMFNIAEDLEVNQLLALDGFSVPPSALMPKKFGFPEGLNAEEYYELLSKNTITAKMIGGSGSGDAESDDNLDNSGNADGKLEGQFDVHITQNDNIYAHKNPGNIADKYGKVGEDRNFKPNVSENQVEKVREICVSAAQIAEKSDKYKGDLPGYLKRFVNKLMTPEIKWQDVLSSFVTRAITDKSSWNRPNRRFISSRTYLPSRDGESVKVGVIIDTSGSTSDDIPKFLGELNGLVKTFGNYTLNILQVDTEVHSCDTYTDEEPLDLENVEFQVNGGGGTIIYPGFEYILEHEDEIECDCICVLTDGFTEKFTESMNPGIPTVWVITKNGSDDNSNFEFGEIVKMKD